MGFRQIQLVEKRRILRTGACAVRWILLTLCIACLLGLSGCSATRLTRSRIETPGWNFAKRTYYSVVPSRIKYSETTQVGLRTLNLDRTVREDPQKAVAALEEQLQTNHRLEVVGILAEVTFEEGRRYSTNRLLAETGRQKMTDWYLQSSRYSFNYLFGSEWNHARNPYSPSFQNVCRIYNESTEQVLRQSSSRDGVVYFENSDSFLLHLPETERAVSLTMRSHEWKLDDFVSFRFASDFEITGLKNRYRLYGLGVPMVAQCRDIYHKSRNYRYCVQELCVPMTVFLSFNERNEPRVEFLDTMESSNVQIGEVAVPLEIDYTTPLAYSFEQSIQKNALDGATLGLLHPDSLLKDTEDGSRKLKGMYMPQAYDPEKIPVVMVHGLWSSTLTWMEMYNTLNSIPQIREHYQFWFYFYPNGQPFWVSAAQLSDDLASLRRDLDPKRSNSNMDRMILVGHSMGGLVALMQTMDSKERLWNLITDVPVEQLPGSDGPKQEVSRWFHTSPNPSINTVITLATPFRGSGFANSTTRGITGIVGQKATLVESNLTQFQKENRDYIRSYDLLQCYTALDALQKSNPFWDALQSCEPAGWVTYYNVVGLLTTQESGSSSDGVVSVESATLPWAQKQVYITSLHRDVPNDAEAILAVANVLMEKLKQ